MTEEWRPVVGWPEYEVSSLGRVRRVAPGRGATVGLVRAPQTRKDGRVIIFLSRPGQRKTREICVLVAEAFIGPRPPGMECCHDNGIPSDNVPTNLYWGTHAQNMADTVRHGTSQRGERHHAARLSLEAVAEIRSAPRAKGSLQILAEQYGVTKSCIKQIRYNQTWSHL